jgi:hypothetical protein
MNNKDSFDLYIDTLDTNNMSNKQHYKNVIYLSQKLQYQLNQLKKKKKKKVESTCSMQCNNNDDDLLLQTSPTETIIAYYNDEKYDHNIKSM